MNTNSADPSWGRPWVVLTVLILAFLTLVLGTSDLVRHPDAMEEPRIEIAIRDFTYVRTKMQSIRAGTPMVFVIHNEDSVSSLFS